MMGIVCQKFLQNLKRNESLIRYAFKSLIAKSPDSREREMGWLSGNFPTSGSSPQISRKMAQRKTKRELTAADISDLSNNCHFLLRALSLLSLSTFLNRLTSWKITELFGLSPQPPVWTLYNTVQYSRCWHEV